MKNSRVSDVRIVKCPKCTKLLPEPADVPVYICGGCNTTLQAKYYKKADDRRNTVSGGSGSIKINDDNSVNEPGRLKVEKPSKSLINAGEVLGDHGSVGKHEDGKASPSSEPKEQVGQDEILVEEELLSVNSSSEDASSETNTTKSEEKALSNQEVGELKQDDEISSCRLEQDEVASSSREVLTSSENGRRNSTVSVQTAELEPKLRVPNFRSEPARPDEPRAGVKKLTSQIVSPDGEVITQNITPNHGTDQLGFGVNYESEVSSRDEHVFIDASSSQFLRSKQFGGVSSETVTPSSDSMLIQIKEPRHSTTESEERDKASLQNDTGECDANKIMDSLPSEINSSFRINSEKMDESALLIPEASKPEVSTPSGEDGKREPDQSFEADAPAYGNNRVPASPSSKTVSQTAVKAIPGEKMADLRRNIDRFESKPSSKVTETAAISADLPKPPTRSPFASEGSLSSCDGNDEKLVDPIAAEISRQRPSVTNKVCSASTLQRQTDDLQTVSGSDSFHSAAQSIPAMLDEIGFMHGHQRRTRTRPRTGRVFPNTSLYRGTPDTSYESSTRASLAHEEIYDHPVRYPPYLDTDSRFARRMFADPIWTKEELPVCPYHESNERHQICCQGARRAAYRPLTHNMAHIPYSGESVRTAYHANDPHYPLRPALESWSSYHHRSRYIPREPFDSYTDSDYYTISDTSGLRSRRKPQPLQHFQPVVGAAPFVTCYECSELLQLPSDFLPFKGVRLHRVKCSACSTVLKYNLEKGRHLVPYSSKKDGVDEGTEPSLTLQRCGSASAYAADSERTSRRGPSSGRCRDKGKGVMGGAPDGPRVTWRRPSRTSPPLHELMGYSSVSAALDGRASSDRGMLAESTN